jgi:DNA primase
MARYTQESREKVRDAIDFAELVGAKTELKRAGAQRLQGLCPFHEERTPSFGIDPVEKLYHCFGCGAGGDVFAFVMETEGLDFAGALESLAERAGVELERDSEDPRDAARRVRRERLLALLERTAGYYVRVLWESPEAAKAREYLAARGLEEATLREFRVGYSPSRWDRVLLASRRAGFSEEELLAGGLVSRSRERAGVYDRFRGRIMFPLADERGRVLGFGARALSEGQQPKYLNTSDGEVFHKGRLVYGADLARAAAAKAGRVVLVEGYTDVIALRQAGVPEVVCSMGTALTDQQVGALARLAPRVLFCQDPDAAGQKAVDRGLTLKAWTHKSNAHVDFRIVRLPSGRDPADVVQQDGSAAMLGLLESAVPLPRYQVERALEADDIATTDGRDAALSAAAEAIAAVPPSVLREELVQLVAGRLNLTESLVAQALAEPSRRPVARDRDAGAPRERATAVRSGGDGGSTWGDPAPDPGGRNSGFGGGGSAVNGARHALDRREQTERAFLAYCLALPDEGERRLAEADLDELFASPATRRAAEYLRGRVRRPAADLPPGDEALARLVAELVIRAGQLEATPAKLELEALQLDLSRLDRLIAGARVSGGEGVHDLAARRQQVLDAIRHRLT